MTNKKVKYEYYNEIFESTATPIKRGKLVNTKIKLDHNIKNGIT